MQGKGGKRGLCSAILCHVCFCRYFPQRSCWSFQMCLFPIKKKKKNAKTKCICKCVLFAQRHCDGSCDPHGTGLDQNLADNRSKHSNTDWCSHQWNVRALQTMKSIKITFFPVGWRSILLQVWNVTISTVRTPLLLTFSKLTSLHTIKVAKIGGVLLVFLSQIINVA